MSIHPPPRAEEVEDPSEGARREDAEPVEVDVVGVLGEVAAEVVDVTDMDDGEDVDAGDDVEVGKDVEVGEDIAEAGDAEADGGEADAHGPSGVALEPMPIAADAGSDVPAPAPTPSTGARRIWHDDPVVQAYEEGRRDGRRATVRAFGGGVSMMAIGALITLLLLYATDSLAASGGRVEDRTLPPREAATAPAAEAAAALEEPIAVPSAAPTPAEPAATGEPFVLAPVDSRPEPSYVTIPAIGVRADVISLGTTPEGALEVPEDFSKAGWWRDGPEPGEVGPSVIVGHVDSFQGPAVFFDLRELRYDDHVTITRVDGSTATFAVRSTLYVDKAAFPTEMVYGPTDGAELRLITCDGDFSDGSYLGNLIVTAVLVDEQPPPRQGALF